MNIQNILLGPLDKKYCIYFGIMSILALIIFIIYIVGSIGLIIYKRKNVFSTEGVSLNIITPLFASILYLMVYYQNRLLYQMCLTNNK
jgi:hypothetical protein